MILTTIVVIVVAAVAVGMSIAFMVIPPSDPVQRRLSRLWREAKAPSPAVTFGHKQKERAERVLQDVGKVMLPWSKDNGRTNVLLMRAGYRKLDSLLVYQGAKVVVPALLAVLILFTGVYRFNPALVLVTAAIVGFVAPDFWLTGRVRSRQKKIVAGLPDALDLLTVCVEAGMGLDQAIYRVSQEIQISCPELSEEMRLMNMEARFGKSRAESMRDMAARTGVEDVKTAVAMLIQTDRFGTDLARALRVHSITMRVKRRQHAEEMASKTSVKMVPALVFFIFPAMFVVILGPAVIALMRTLKL
jgi:tight adherence protein C